MIASVIGLGYGDEGKGLVTDYLARKCEGNGATVVIRFSGGQQAGHTVVAGKHRHIFSNYGSGSLAGAASFFSEHCTFYPPNILREREALDKIKGANTMLTIHPLCNLTTHYDIAYNRFLETFTRRDKTHHGSCGLGINATIERNTNSPYRIYAADLMYPSLFHQKLTNIWTYYDKKLSQGSAFYQFSRIAKELEADFIMGCKKIIDECVIKIRDYVHIADYPNIIFEGSQGILLDQDHGLFPAVTRANTTSKNISDILTKLDLFRDADVDTYYVTRCYQTRHGKGWMNKHGDIGGFRFEDNTNVHNEWQEELRFAEFDYEAIIYAHMIDEAYKKYDGKSKIVFTHMDQRPKWNIDITKLPGCYNHHDILISRGPRATDITQVKLKEYQKIIV